ncbi:MAG: hypothetical protein Q4E12_06390 [Coriobacteriia bacterium]|nr:hypothetical protein [Coriobacteriia bacterium]
MNPVIIIPTYVAANRKRQSGSITQQYDHATLVGTEGTLPRCLDSLTQVNGIGQIIILVVADAAIQERAAQTVHAIAQRYPTLHTAVIGADELDLLRQRMDQLNLGDLSEQINLTSYSASHNLGVALTHALGFDAVVFIDDSEIIEDPDFLKKAVYGLGKMTRNGIPILAKTGYYYNENDSYLAEGGNNWYNRHWQQAQLFNEWIQRAMVGKRISRSNRVCGGCLALHKEAFKRVAFDPWIPRGEDLDYMLNLRMYGSDMWFDNQWSLKHLPPNTGNEGLRFRQDVYRWLYEFRKLEFSRAQIDLLQIKPSSLQPYPGPMLEPGVAKRLRKTANLRALVRPNKAEYRMAASAAKNEAATYADENCGKYFEFQRVWPEVMARLEGDVVLRNALVQSAVRRREEAEDAQAATMAATIGFVRPIKDAPKQDEEGLDPGVTCEINLNIQDEQSGE